MDTIRIEEGEHILLTVRKHWLILLRDSIGTIALSFLPYLLFGMISFTGLVPVIEFANPYVVYAAALWSLLIWMTLAIIWTNYYLDIWILTDRRIFVIEQVGLFDRRVATWGLERIQHITVEHQNVIEILFGFGTLTIETAGHSEHDLSAHGVPDPEKIRTRILHQIGVIGQLQAITKKQSDMISHEAKGYLARDAAALAELTEEKTGVPAELKKLADVALGETRRGVSTMMNILSGNADKGEIEIDRVRFDLAPEMRDAVENAQPAASAKGLTLTLRSPKSVMIDGDPTKVRDIVFKNLLENAIHYTDHGSVTVEVSQGNGRALVRITDTGIGISGEDMRRLFTPGGRGETARAKNPHSTGYGLYISKQIVEAHGGRLWLESDGPGTGTRTYVELAVAA
jgi:signal transduction histidine kinase